MSNTQRSTKARWAANASVAVWCACASVQVDPRVHDVKTVAVASIYADADISLNGLGYDNNGLGAEVIDMEFDDAQAQAAAVLGATALPFVDVQKSKRYDRVPEALPVDAYSQVRNVLPMDMTHDATPQALGALAKALRVDAAVVVRHRFSMSRLMPMTTFSGPRTMQPTVQELVLVDRCSMLVVAPDGSVLARVEETTQSPLGTMFAQSPDLGLVGMWADEARMHAKKAGRQCVADLGARIHARAPQAAP